MSITPRQEKLFTAVTSIDDQYLDEASAFPKEKQTNTFKRLIAVAAAIAILVGSFAIWPNFDFSILSFSVAASDMEEAKILISYGLVPPYSPNMGHVKDNLSEEWRDKDLFYIRIGFEGYSKEWLRDTYTKVYYKGEGYTESATTDALSIRIPASNEEKFVRENFCTIYGWTDKSLHFSLCVYRNEGDDTVEIFSQDFLIYYDETYTINGASTASKVDPLLYLKTNEQLIEDIINNESLAGPFIFSSPFQYKSTIYKLSAQELTVLYTRKGAAQAMLKKIYELQDIRGEVNITSKETIQIMALCSILSSDIFVSQLSEEELKELNERVPAFKYM